jgi:hypothetical protein
MMDSLTHGILRLGSFTRDLVVSAAGCFQFMPGFRMVTTGSDGVGAPLSVHNAGNSSKPLAGVGAAFFLLSFIASEALATIRALGH